MRNLLQGKKSGLILGLAAVMLLLSGSSAFGLFGGKITEFSADQVMINPGGVVMSQGKIFMAKDKMRMEQDMSQQGGGKMIIIHRQDQNITWMLNPDKKLYTQNLFNEQELERVMKSTNPSSNERVLGSEKVNGFMCTKKEVVTSMNVMGMNMTTKSIIWVSDKLAMPIRTQSDDGSITELRNINKGAPSGKHFEIPSGYTQVSNIMELMGGMDKDRQQRSRRGQSMDAPRGRMPPADFPFEFPEGMEMPDGLNFPFGNN
ncbi:MAG: DUF4412 domain-containing protein [Thermodesulfobacteriota bacterium]|nr:DUF4412 domain-containing protein [Thermodesulfobacteriota bacterium]